MVNGQVDATGPAVLKAVLLDRHGHRRIINDRQHLIHMFGQQLVKQDFVTVLQHIEVDVLPRVVRLLLVLHIGAFHLLVEGGHGFGQQAGQAKRFSLLGGEGVTFVQKRLV